PAHIDRRFCLSSPLPPLYWLRAATRPDSSSLARTTPRGLAAFPRSRLSTVKFMNTSWRRDGCTGSAGGLPAAPAGLPLLYPCPPPGPVRPVGREYLFVLLQPPPGGRQQRSHREVQGRGLGPAGGGDDDAPEEGRLPVRPLDLGGDRPAAG